MKQKKLPEFGTPEYHQLIYDYYHKMAEGLRACVKLVEIGFVENLNEDQINIRLEIKQQIESQIKSTEDEMLKIISYTSAVPRVPPYEQPLISNQPQKKRKSWLARLLGR